VTENRKQGITYLIVAIVLAALFLIVAYLAEFLLAKGYEVYGIIRRSSSFNTGRLKDIYKDPHLSHNRLHLIYGDLNDASSVNRILKIVKPVEIYNLAAQSHVKVSFEIPEYTSEVTALGALRILEAIRESKIKTKFYQASSSELFGRAKSPQSATRWSNCSIAWSAGGTRPASWASPIAARAASRRRPRRGRPSRTSTACRFPPGT